MHGQPHIRYANSWLYKYKFSPLIINKETERDVSMECASGMKCLLRYVCLINIYVQFKIGRLRRPLTNEKRRHERQKIRTENKKIPLYITERIFGVERRETR
jgi:hypothetical protein